MGSARKFNFLIPVVILCCISNFAYAMYEFDEGPVDPPDAASSRKPNPGKKSWRPYYPLGGHLIMDEFGNVEVIKPPPFINLSVENPTSRDLLSIDVWYMFDSSAYRPIDATYSIIHGNINIDVVIQDLWGSGGFYAMGSQGIGATVDLRRIPQGHYTVNANIYLRPWDESEIVLYSALDSISFDVVRSGRTTTPGPATVPEPATLGVLFLGCLGLLRRRLK